MNINRWNKLVEFFTKIETLVNSNKYVVMYDLEYWEVSHFVIDEEKKEIYIIDDLSLPSLVQIQYFFKDSEHEYQETAEKIILDFKERFKLFENKPINF